MASMIQEVQMFNAYTLWAVRNGINTDGLSPVFTSEGDMIVSGFDSLTDGVRWTDPNNPAPDPLPTNAELITIQNEIEQEAENLAAIETGKAAMNATLSRRAIAQGIFEDIVGAFAGGNSVTLSQGYQAFANRLIGSEFDGEIQSYVTMMTGLTAFGQAIPDAEKRQILLHAKLYLLAVLQGE